jgi:hypothetical protein
MPFFCGESSQSGHEYIRDLYKRDWSLKLMRKILRAEEVKIFRQGEHLAFVVENSVRLRSIRMHSFSIRILIL